MLTLTRREILRGLGAGALASLSSPLLLPACKRSPSSSSPNPKPQWPRTTVYEGIEMVELFPQDGIETSPLIVFIHGMGGKPQNTLSWWSEFPKKAHIALPRAFDPHGDGFSWFEFKDGMTDEQFGAAVASAEARLWKGIAALANKRRPIVTGFSQGGILSFAIASRHPDDITRAFPISGSCPGPLLPQNKSRAAPLLAFHGTEDKVLDIKWGREAVHAFKEQGNDAEMKEYPGVGHVMTPELRQDVREAIIKAMPPA